MGFQVLAGVLVTVVVVASYPVTYVQPSPQHGQQTVSPQQYRVLLQQAQPQVGAALYQQQPQTQSLIYQQQVQPQPQPQSQPQVYSVPRLKARPVPTQQPGEQVIQEAEDYDPNPHYQFAFDVKDDEFTNYQNRKEQREGGKISGSYSVVDSDGFIRTVKYTANPEEGFKAQVTREPTNIVVKIPTPTPAQEQVQQPHQYIAQPVPSRQPFAQVYNSVASQPTPEQLAQLRTLARQQFTAVPQPQPVPAAAAAPQPVQYQGVQPHVQYTPQPEVPRPKAVKAGAIEYLAQQPGASVVYQAYQE
ncbi:cuticle protein isoform X2 [Zootermopsis nevadensis]|uniref:Cuticle protein n=1 Tax=Zootermopsis nevadensis TaxID=136037 RepID=A0A067QU47_ZOONE|nr:cuticle protein isoform X2 [Zootermopsis nevadensis]KDR12507.1 Cuticle protein [Zootermopsis nevadensis]